MPDVINRVTTIYKAETAEARHAVQTLRGVERDRAREVLNDLNAHNAKLQDSIATYAKFGIAVGAVAGAVALGQKAWRSYVEDVRLESSAMGADLGGLRKATMGLVEADDLLAFAGKTMHGVWELNQAEMERVLRGATALRKTMGVELTPTVAALTEAITKGNTRALKEFGIEAKDKEGLLRELDALYKNLGGSAALAGDDVAASGVKMADAMDDAAGSMGRAVDKLSPLVAGFAGLVHALGDFINLIGDLPDWLVPDDVDPSLSPRDQILQQVGQLRSQAYASRRTGRAGAFLDERTAADPYNNGLVNLFTGRTFSGAFEKAAADLDRQADEMLRPVLVDVTNETIATINGAIAEAMRKDAEKAAAAAKGRRGLARGRGRGGDVAGRPLEFGLDGLGGSLADSLAGGAQGVYQGWRGAAAGTEFAQAYERGEEARRRAQAELDASAAKLAAFESRLGALSQVFGTPAHLSAHNEAITALASSYSVLGDAAGDAYEALVTGSGSATAAMKAAIAQGLLALGRDFAVRALGETAMGLGSLALGPIGGASAGQHFAAAAAFGAAAVAAGVGARAMGVGSNPGGARAASAGAAGGAGSYLGGGSRGGGDINRHVTIILGGGFDGMSARQRDSAIARSIRSGMAADHSSTMRDG